jgi:hypothetical protein
MKSWILSALFFSLTAFNPLLGYAQSEEGYNEYNTLFENYKNEGFKDEELKILFDKLIILPNNRHLVPSYLEAVKTPYAPEGSHTGERFFKSLSWYNDTTKGNRNGLFTLEELNSVFDKEMKTYLTHLQTPGQEEARIASWKMLQKLKLLQKEILRLGQPGYFYEPRAMFDIDHNSPWNKDHTIQDINDFQKNVIEASFHKPVLVKYGLTYCVHCLLLENLGSVPAVHKKYGDLMDVYKLWWNPKSEDYKELNSIAKNEGITSSPVFILYKDGKQIKKGYAFPDERGEGIEDFIAPIL